MPATRSGKSSSKEQQPTISSSRPFPIDEDVIVISSDDDFLDLASIQALAKGRPLKKKLPFKERASNQVSDVSSVLSEQGNQLSTGHSSCQKKSEGERRRLESLLQQATADIDKLQSSLRLEKDALALKSAKIKKLLKCVKKAAAESADLKRANEGLLNRMSNHKSLHEIEEHLLCEICEDKLWHPYTITECGHTLCQGCLIDWFNTALTANAQQPNYECPKCRTSVHKQPIENFTIKEIVRAIAHSIDPTIQSPHRPLRKNMSHSGPWVKFFGK